MTFLTRREFSTLQDRVNRISRESYSPEGPGDALTTANFAPPVDVYEDEQGVTLKIEVPGIDEKDIDVSIASNTLTVRGERTLEKEEKEENFQRVERLFIRNNHEKESQADDPTQRPLSQARDVARGN